MSYCKMLMNDTSLKVETNDISGQPNARSFEPYAKNSNTSILAEIRADELCVF